MRPTPLVWSEEELRYLEPPPPRLGPPSRAYPLRASLAIPPTTPHETTRSSIIHSPAAGSHGNFTDASYRRILAQPLWAARLRKPHTAKRLARPSGPDELIRPWRELDAATSSDALLMNVFCYPRVLATPRLPALLGVPPGLEPTFGYRPQLTLHPGRRNKPLKDRTEIDMRLGTLLVEAKLTETDFQFAPIHLLERYPAFPSVFDPDLLELAPRGIRNYQLLRGILAAHADPASRFCVFLDARRPDLREAWYATVRAVRSYQLQSRLRLVTWQEIAAALPSPLRNFLAGKYNIQPT